MKKFRIITLNVVMFVLHFELFKAGFCDVFVKLINLSWFLSATRWSKTVNAALMIKLKIH